MNRVLFTLFLGGVAVSLASVFELPVSFLGSSLSILDASGLMLLTWFFFQLAKKRDRPWITFFDVIVLILFLEHLAPFFLQEPAYRPSDIRLLLGMMAFYLFGRFFLFKRAFLEVIIYGLGFLTLIFGFVGVFFLLFPSETVLLMQRYFFGDQPASFLYDLQRGRLALWGNILAAFPFMVSSGVLLRQRQRRVISILLVSLGTGLTTLVLALSGSRWRVICFVVELLIMFVFLIRRRFFSVKSAILFGFIFASTFYFSAQIATSVFGYNIIERFALTDYTRDVLESKERLLFFERSWNLFQGSPFFGVGIGNYLEADSGDVIVTDTPSHNVFLTFLAERGGIGFVLFLIVLVVFFRDCSTAIRTESFLLVFAVFLSAVIYLINGMADSYPTSSLVYLWAMIGLIHQMADAKVKRKGFNE